ncbi:MAG TPA: ASPIC/UnbV domain-containing protein [Planctomycetaceae bacterium]|nr:ASPIC/UnbV domain-containing protein [Planctomycetaceae bacterium]
MLLMGNGAGGFSEDSEAGGDFVRDIASGRGLIYGNFDNDGDLDLLVTNCGGRARLYRNDLPKSGNWLRIRVVDHVSGRDTLGSTVIVGTSERRLTQILAPQSSYLASHEPVLHFGLRPTESVESVTVYWPDGPVEMAGEEYPRDRWEVNRLETLRRGTGTPVAVEINSTGQD